MSQESRAMDVAIETAVFMYHNDAGDDAVCTPISFLQRRYGITSEDVLWLLDTGFIEVIPDVPEVAQAKAALMGLILPNDLKAFVRPGPAAKAVALQMSDDASTLPLAEAERYMEQLREVVLRVVDRPLPTYGEDSDVTH